MSKIVIDINELIETISNSDCIAHHDGGTTYSNMINIIHNFAIDKCEEKDE